MFVGSPATIFFSIEEKHLDGLMSLVSHLTHLFLLGTPWNERSPFGTKGPKDTFSSRQVGSGTVKMDVGKSEDG